MAKFEFYEVNRDYVDFLRQADSKIPNLSYSIHEKFVCGILFRLHGMDYFAPVSSFPKQQRTNFLMKNEQGKVMGSLRFSFMFPIPPAMLTRKEFALEEPHYKRLLMEEIQFCNTHQQKIMQKASYVYEGVTVRMDETLVRNCCDFDRLEEQCRRYCRQNRLQYSEAATQKLPDNIRDSTMLHKHKTIPER